MHNLLYCKIHIFICDFVWCSALVCLTLDTPKLGGGSEKIANKFAFSLTLH